MRLLIAGLAALAAGGLAYGLILLARPGRPRVGPALEPYTVGRAEPASSSRTVTLAETSLLQAAIQVTGRVARQTNVLARVEALLDRADVPLRPAEALFFYLTTVGVVGLLALALSHAPFPTFAAVALAATVPAVAVRVIAGRRRRAFTAQLPDTLRMLASALRSGRSLLQGVQDVAGEADDPVGGELRGVLAQARLGRPVEDALDDMAGRMGSPDCQFAVTAIRIQRQIGGNLAELLGNVAETMVSRSRIRGEVKALTAEGRVSAVMLGILPVAVGVLISTVNPGYISVLFHDPLGQSMLLGAGGLALAGFVWMQRIVDIEV